MAAVHIRYADRNIICPHGAACSSLRPGAHYFSYMNSLQAASSSSYEFASQGMPWLLRKLEGSKGGKLDGFSNLGQVVAKQPSTSTSNREKQFGTAKGEVGMHVALLHACARKLALGFARSTANSASSKPHNCCNDRWTWRCKRSRMMPSRRWIRSGKQTVLMPGVKTR